MPEMACVCPPGSTFDEEVQECVCDDSAKYLFLNHADLEDGCHCPPRSVFDETTKLCKCVAEGKGNTLLIINEEGDECVCGVGAVEKVIDGQTTCECVVKMLQLREPDYAECKCEHDDQYLDGSLLDPYSKCTCEPDSEWYNGDPTGFGKKCKCNAEGAEVDRSATPKLCKCERLG